LSESPSRPFAIRPRFEAPRVTAVTGAKIAYKKRLYTHKYFRSASFSVLVAVRPLVEMVVKADAAYTPHLSASTVIFDRVSSVYAENFCYWNYTYSC
jgi:hypothetical protein